MKNDLDTQQSPYLKAHALNPVHWMVWDEKAFKKAQEEDKPIFLSIGYSTCHWCHVMEAESFESVEVAQVLNRNFISIKVDRELRPDVDQVYMSALQALGQNGGWPLSMWLTPGLKPFFGGTYFPKARFIQILDFISERWKSDRENILKSAESLTQFLTKQETGLGQGQAQVSQVFQNFLRIHEKLFDPEHGGFGGAPKFPQTMNVQSLLRIAQLDEFSGNQELIHGWIRKTLDGMARGGLRDHVEGGFHRYCVDETWSVPHFEKMLYDNALCALTFLEAGNALSSQEYRWLGLQTLEACLVYFQDQAGGFFSAFDADSLIAGKFSKHEKEEGFYYVYDYEVLKSELPPEVFDRALQVFEISPEGNFEGKNVLKIQDQVRLDSPEIEPLLPYLKKIREQNAPPDCDHKILASWNGLMIRALSQGYLQSGRDEFKVAAEKAANRFTEEFRKNGFLPRAIIKGLIFERGFSSDYANFIAGLLGLYQASSERKYFDAAVEMQACLDRDFQDATDGRYFKAQASQTDIVVRMKEDHDGVRPTACSQTLYNFYEFFALTGDQAFQARCQKLKQTLELQLSRNPYGLSWAVGALAQWEKGFLHFKLSPNSKFLEPVLAKLRSQFLPDWFLSSAISNNFESRDLLCDEKSCKPVTLEMVKTLSKS